MINFKILFTTGFFFLLFHLSFSQHYHISGRVIDADTKQPVDSALIYIFGKGYIKYDYATTDSTGYFRFDSLTSGRYTFDIYHDQYKTTHKLVAITDSSVHTEFQIYHRDSSGVSKIEDLAYEDNFHGGMSVNFYNPEIDSKPDLFKSSFNIEYLYSFKKKLTHFDQIGLEFIPIKLVWHNLKNDTIITNEAFRKERYFAYYFSTFVYNRLFISKQKKSGALGLFLDVGVGYELPVLFRYYAQLDRNNTLVKKHIHNFNEWTGLVRIGFDVVSVKATYRFFDIMRNDFPEPPKLKIGLEFNIPSRF